MQHNAMPGLVGRNRAWMQTIDALLARDFAIKHAKFPIMDRAGTFSALVRSAFLSM